MTATSPTIPAIEPYPRPVQAWATVFILLLLYVVSMLDRNIITLLGEQIRIDLDLTDVQLSLLYGPAFAVSFAAGALPLGWAMDRFSRRKVLWAGVTVWSFGTMLCGLSHTFTQIFGARALVGAGEAALVPGNQSILADTFPPDRLGFPISIYSLGSKFGQGGSLIIGGFLTALIAPSALIALPLLGDLYGWQVILVVVGAPGLLLALLIFAIPEPVRRNRASPGTDPVGYPKFFAFMKENARFFTGIIGGGTMASVAVSAIMAWTPTYFIRLHDMSFGEAGYWLGLAIMIGPVIGLPLHGLIADRLFRRGIRDAHLRYLVFACLLGMPLLAGSFVTSNTVLALIVFSIGYTLFHAFAVLGVVSLQLRVPGDMRGKAASISLVTTSIIGLSLGPVVTAWISEGLFNDPMMIGYALGACAAIFLPLTALFYSLAMKPIRTHLEAQERALA